MRHAKFFSIFVFITVLGYGAVSFFFLPLATFQGDLTRIGLLPESLFGWTKSQPALDTKWMQQASMLEADVLVIGDSFSDSHVWQSILTQRGLKVRTEHWDYIRGICTDFMPWLRAQGFNGKYLILESVERGLVGNLSKSVGCHQTRYHPNFKTEVQHHAPMVSFDVNYGNYTGKLSTAIRTELNVLKYERLTRTTDFSTYILPNNVKIARIENGCKLFSHARCNDVLFFGEDSSGEIDTSAFKSIEILNSRLTGITPIWVFVPNKSTVYLYPDKQFWNKAERRFQSPNLLRMSQHAINEQIIDLYPANNTHFSTTGYLMMGEMILKAIQQAQPDNR